MEPELFEMLLQSVREADKLSSMTETATSKLDNMPSKEFENLCARYGHNPRKSTHTLDELLSQCDENAPMPEDFELWDKMKSVGSQLLTPKGMSL